MTDEIIESVKRETTAKVMVLGIHRDEKGKILITPLDATHDGDDRRDLSETEVARKKQLRGTYEKNEEAMKRGLEALYEIFEGRLCRDGFRNFENFCFAIFGTHRIPTEAEKRAKARIKELNERI